VGPLGRRQAVFVASRRGRAVEVEIRLGGEDTPAAVLAHTGAVDLREDARGVRVEWLPAASRRGEPLGTVVVPGLAVGLARHVRQRVGAVLGAQGDLVDRTIIRPLTLAVEDARGI